MHRMALKLNTQFSSFTEELEVFLNLVVLINWKWIFGYLRK